MRQPRPGIMVPEPSLPLKVKPLAEVPWLREDALRQNLQEWPKENGRLPAETWGYLGDPSLPSRPDEIPLTLIATDERNAYVGQGSILARDLDHRLYRNLGPWMGGLCVLPHFRARGIGKMLHYERLRIAAEMGIDELFLFTEQRPYKTVDLYKQFGWTVECELPDWNDGSTTERRWVMTVNPQTVFPA